MKENEKIFNEINNVLKPIEFGPPVKNPKNKIIVTKREINALRKYLKTKEYLEKEVFPKIKLTFNESLQPVK